MMFTDGIEEKIGFTRIAQLVADRCRGALAKSFALKMKPGPSFELMESWLLQSKEFKEILEESGGPVLLVSDELGQIFDKLSLKNNFLEYEELIAIRDLIHTAGAAYAFFGKNREQYPNLQLCLEDASIDETLVSRIDKLFTPNGEWKYNASKKLGELHEREDDRSRNLKRHLNSVYKKCSESGWTAETDITIRDGRFVIPIIAEHKRKVDGVIQDVSGNGKIFYIEPLGSLEMANELTEIRSSIRQEKTRLLRALCNDLRPHLSEFKLAANRLALLEFIKAKARMAIDLDAHLPEIHRSGKMLLKDARHPLLYLSHKQKGLEVVPLNIELNKENKLLLISGPNAGGKSVALKTVALLQYCLQSGLLIPCHPESSIGFYSNIFVDIGDDQSIDNDLSSYSSHLKNMKFMLANANADTLCCIDEIGVGTDPQFGQALAASILKELNQKGIFGVVTTHYGQLKALADKESSMINGRMNFDAKKFEPLFTLAIGKPGSSFAFELAERTGFSKDIMKEARKRIDIRQEKVDRLLSDLENEKSAIELDRENLQRENREMERMKSEYRKLKDEVDQRKRSIIENAQSKALKILQDANADVENTIREIREEGAAKMSTRKIRAGLERKKSKLDRDLTKQNKVQKEQPAQEEHVLQVGDQVRIKGSESTGEIIELRKNKALVVAGILKSTVKLTDLQPVKAQARKPKNDKTINVRNYILEKEKDFKIEKDMRGMRMQEALETLDDWIDTAIMLGFTQLRLIHGKGDGILKNAIRDHLRNKSYVKGVQYEHVDLGGEGVSLIELQP